MDQNLQREVGSMIGWMRHNVVYIHHACIVHVYKKKFSDWQLYIKGVRLWASFNIITGQFFPVSFSEDSVWLIGLNQWDLGQTTRKAFFEPCLAFIF